MSDEQSPTMELKDSNNLTKYKTAADIANRMWEPIAAAMNRCVFASFVF